MLSSPWVRKTATVLGLAIALVGGAYFYAVTPHHSSAPPDSADGLLDKADTLSWGNRWAEAQPIYAKASQLFRLQNRPSKALYAAVSEIPADESVSAPATILRLTQDLAKPETQDPETKLRILTIRGMLQVNYDAAEARATWQEVFSLAIKLHHYELATRAEGEQGTIGQNLQFWDEPAFVGAHRLPTGIKRPKTPSQIAPGDSIVGFTR